MKDGLFRVFLAATILILASLGCSVLGSGALLEDDFQALIVAGALARTMTVR